MKKTLILMSLLSCFVLVAFNAFLLLEMKSDGFEYKTKRFGRDIAYKIEKSWDSFEYQSKRIGKSMMHELENTFEKIEDIFD